MSKARTLANLISDNAELADGQISVAEVVGAAPTASPTFTGTVNADAITMSGFLTVNGGADFNTVLYPDGIAMADSRTISFGTSADFEVNGGSTFLDFNLKDNARHLRIKNGLVEHHRFSGDGSVIFNESGADANFRIESDNSEYMLYVDGGTNSVGIKTNATDAALNVNSQSNSIDGIRIVGSGGNNFITGYGNQGNLSFAIREGEADDAAELTLFRSGSAQHKLFADSGTSVVFNEQGDDIDFRVESDNNTHALFVEAGANRVGINNNNPNSQLDISGAGVPRVTLTSTSGPYGYMEVNTVGSVGFGADPNGSGNSTNMAFNVDNVETARFYSDLNVFNEGSGNIDFRVESNNNASMLFVDAGNDRVGVGTSAPRSSLILDVAGDIGQTWIDGEQFVGQQYSTGGYRLGIITDSTDRTAQLVANAGDNNGKLEFYTNSNRAGVVSPANDWTFFEGVTINENGGNNDFRVEGNNVSNGIVYDADDETVCFFTSSTGSNITSGINFKRDGSNTSWQNIGHTTAAGDGFSYIQFMYNGGRIGQAVQSGTTGVTYQTTSDYRLKENAVAITSATERVKQLNPIRFNFISEPDRTIDGFLAHEVQAVVPEAVSGTKDEVDSNGRPEYQGLDTSRLVPVLVATIKELEARITALENA